MNLIQKLQQIIQIQDTNSDEEIAELNKPIKEAQIKQIEALLSEQLPEDFKAIYHFADGQIQQGKGALFYERLMSSEEIIQQLEFSKSLIKPENPYIENPEVSATFLKKIADFFVSKIPKHNFFGFKKSWYKLEFTCGTYYFKVPYLYASEKTTSSQREILAFTLEIYDEIIDTVKSLQTEERAYNWDELDFTVFSNGKFEVKRSFLDLHNPEYFTSTPENAIKKNIFTTNGFLYFLTTAAIILVLTSTQTPKEKKVKSLFLEEMRITR